MTDEEMPPSNAHINAQSSFASINTTASFLLIGSLPSYRSSLFIFITSAETRVQEQRFDKMEFDESGRGIKLNEI